MLYIYATWNTMQVDGQLDGFNPALALLLPGKWISSFWLE